MVCGYRNMGFYWDLGIAVEKFLVVEWLRESAR